MTYSLTPLRCHYPSNLLGSIFFLATLVPETDTRCNKEKPRLNEAMLETETSAKHENNRHDTKKPCLTRVHNCNVHLYQSVIPRFVAFQKNVATQSLVSTLDNVTFCQKL